MTREIKFRAWDEKNGMMIRSGHCIEFDGSVHRYEQGCVLRKSDLILMQYTGLKDRNGTEIYEGDIVKDRILNRTFTVIWRSCAMYTGFNIDWNIPEDRYEIMGNTYQNPELINNNK